jgi:RNA polymerase sigma-70 factor (ECF subfamily)
VVGFDQTPGDDPDLVDLRSDMQEGRGLTDQDDNALIQFVAQGDSAALAELYDRYGRLAYGLAYRVLSDGQAAEEAVQDAFLQVWRKAGTFDPERGAGFRAWLLTIVHNRAIDTLRRRARHDSREVELDPGAPFQGDADPVFEVLGNLDRDQIRKAMATLPADQRNTIEMAYFEGLTHREIAERHSLPLGTVKGRLRLGLHKLHELLLLQGATNDPQPG